MQRFAIYPLLGPALVFYMIADVASTRGRLDAIGYLIAAVSIALSFSQKTELGGDARSRRVLAWLGSCASVAILRLLHDETPRLWTSLSEAIALSLLGAFAFDLALSSPEPLGPKRLRRSARVLAYVVAAISGIVSCVALGPEFSLFGQLWIVPAHFSESALWSASGLVWGAFVLRAVRRRVDTQQEVIASNQWAAFGLVPSALLGPMFLLQLPPSAAWIVRVWSAVSALALYGAHVASLDSTRRLRVSPATRDGFAALLTVTVAAGAAATLSASIPAGALPRGLWVAGTLFSSMGLYLALRPLLRRASTPDAGRLLDAIAATEPELGRAQTIERLLAISLGGLRAATGGGESRPILYGFDPVFEGHLDAAGGAHVHQRPPHPMLLAQLQEQPGELIVRSDLQQQMVRKPTVRPLVEALLELDVLCVVPLVVEGELEGALLLPRVTRRAPLSAEEQLALWDFARKLAGLLAVFSAKARADQRANLATLENTRVKLEIDELRERVQRMGRDLEVLQLGRSLQAEAATLVAYSAAQRTFLAELKASPKDGAFSLIAETGIDVLSIARYVHAHSDRADAPFVVLDCAFVRYDQADAALFGGEGPLGNEVGCLRIAGSGTLLLLDAAALTLDVQRKLALALGSRRAMIGEASYAVDARLIVSSRENVVGLATQGRFAVELADHLTEGPFQVPPLRECREDVSSLVLLAIDRACRRHGRGPMGIESEALTLLRDYDFPGNHAELTDMIERAVAQARGLRLSVSDLAAGRVLAAKSGEEVLSGTFEEVERRVLSMALQRAGGNKSEAARLLAMPRTTLLDKLRRHKLDEPRPETERPN